MYEALYPNAGIKELLLQLVDWKCLQILHDIPRFYLCYMSVKVFEKRKKKKLV